MKKSLLPLLTTMLVLSGILFAGWLVWRLAMRSFRPRSYWVEAMRSEDVNVRFEAVQALGKSSLKEKSPDTELLAALRDENADVRLTAADLLGKLGLQPGDEEPPSPQGMRAVPALIGALHDKHAGVRKEAARSILRIVGIQEYYRWRNTSRLKLVRELSNALHDEQAIVRRNSCHTLGIMGLNRSEASIAVPALVKALQDQDPTVADAAAEALKQIEPQAAAKAGVQ
jgi:HEAT repeat protein